MVIRKNVFQKTSYVIAWLVFSFFIIGCKEKKENPQSANRPIIVGTEGTLPVSLIIPLEWLQNASEKDIREELRISLEGSPTPILGELGMEEDAAVFKPLLPFTRGMSYQVFYKKELLETIDIRASDNRAAELIFFYPSGDTIPENLLKIHLQFSKPMQEGVALDHIAVIKNEKDTMQGIFLDLQPELWNTHRTELTLWLDPGRIKKDLQPNKELGAPLQEKNFYRVVVSGDWQDADGIKLGRVYEKKYMAGPRDSDSPDPSSWKIYPPRADDIKPLQIDMHEPLDYVLLMNTVRIVDRSGNIVAGQFVVDNHDSSLYFNQLTPWKQGDYTIEIEARLEDLAGNNLDRLFDKDLTKKSAGGQKQVYKREFSVR